MIIITIYMLYRDILFRNFVENNLMTKSQAESWSLYISSITTNNWTGR